MSRLLKIACFTALSVWVSNTAGAQQTDDKIAAIAGQWDLPGTRTSIEIRSDGTVQHWSLGSGFIQHELANIFLVTFSQHENLKCHYEIKRYSPTELSMIVSTRPAPQDCELGVLRRAPKDDGDSNRSDEIFTNTEDSGAGSHQTAGGKTTADCDKCPELVTIPAGTFLMGSPDDEAGRTADEGPQRRVVFKHPIEVGRYAVTLDEFRAFMTSTGYRTSDKCGAAADWDAASVGSYEAPPGFAAGFVQNGRNPVVCVSWQDAKAYVAWLAEKTKKPYRLLTEAEREYVARAGTSTPYWWGAGIAPSQALYDSRPRSQTMPATPTAESKAKQAEKTSQSVRAEATDVAPPGRTANVDAYRPNDWGLYQVHGNVAEWTEDCWTDSIASSSDSGAAVKLQDCEKHVIKGGGWSDWPEALRSAARQFAPTDGRYNHIGFRVARDGVDKD